MALIIRGFVLLSSGQSRRGSTSRGKSNDVVLVDEQHDVLLLRGPYFENIRRGSVVRC